MFVGASHRVPRPAAPARRRFPLIQPSGIPNRTPFVAALTHSPFFGASNSFIFRSYNTALNPFKLRALKSIILSTCTTIHKPINPLYFKLSTFRSYETPRNKSSAFCTYEFPRKKRGEGGGNWMLTLRSPQIGLPGEVCGGVVQASACEYRGGKTGPVGFSQIYCESRCPQWKQTDLRRNEKCPSVPKSPGLPV